MTETAVIPGRTANAAPLPPVEVRIAPAPVPYPEALAAMEARAAAIAKGEAAEQLWFLEHPPLYTAGTSAKPADLLADDRFPVFKAGRGGQYTYHGPGQRVVYAMLDLNHRQRDVRRFVQDLEAWLMAALARVNVTAERRDGRIGLWVARDNGRREDKIAAIGVRVRQWVTFHGASLNVAPDLSHFGGIVPCGISEHGVTSLRDLGQTTTLAEMDAHLIAAFTDVFGRTTVKI